MTNTIYYAVADRTDEQLGSFSERYNYISEDEVVSAMSHYGYRVELLEKSKSWGTAHVVYFVTVQGQKDRLVFRSNAGEKGGFYSPEVTMLSEKIVTEALHLLGLRTNRVLHVDISRKIMPFDFQIEQELTGEDPEQYIDEKTGKFLGTKEDYDKMSFELGAMIAKYSEIKYSGFGIPNEEILLESGDIVGSSNTFYEYITTNLDVHLSYLVEYGLLSKEEKDNIIDIFQNNKDRINTCESCLIHHDLADHNIMYNIQGDNKLAGVFDWEAMVIGDPMLDLGSCPTWGTHYDRKQLLLEGYASIKKLPEDYETRIDLYELRTWIWKLMFVHRMNFDSKIVYNCQRSLKKVLLKLK